MNIFLSVLGLTAIIHLATSSLILAQQPLSAEIRQKAEEYRVRENKQNLSGWNGILFFCPFDDESGQVLKDICEKTYVNAEFLAVTAKVNLIKARSGFEVGFKAGTGDQLVLEVHLHATKHGVPAAIHAGIRAYAYYYEAVTTKPLLEGGMKDARLTPRSGDLIFWERTVLGASSGMAQDLVTPLSQGIEQRLKEFFADYLKAQR